MSTQTIADKVQTSASLDTEEVQQFQNILDRAMQSAAELDKLFNRGQGNGAVHDLRMYAGGFLARVSGDDPEVVNTDYTGNFMVLTGVDVGGTLYSVGGMSNGVLQWGASYLDGKLYAGGGDVIIDTDGITIIDAGGSNSGSVKWKNGSTYIGAIGAYASGVTTNFFFEAEAFLASPNAKIEFRASPSSDINQTVIHIEALETGEGSITLNADNFDVDTRINWQDFTSALFVDGLNGRTGLGTESPSEKLHVVGNILATGTISGTFSGTYSDAEIAAIAGLTSAADSFPYFTGSGTAALLVVPSAVRTFLATPSSANLRGAVSDETGTGSLVFATSPTLVTPILGTPTSGNLANCTFPTLNQNTTGSAASLSISGQTGLLTFAGLTSTNRAKTVRDAADTILELGGSYTPTGTWTNMPLTTPAFTGTPTGTVTSGTYTPTLTNTTNVAASTSAQCNYLRVGNQVTVSGRIAIDPTAAVATLLEISLPIASNFASAADCGGVAACGSVAGMSAAIDANVGNDTAQLQYIATDLANRVWAFTFTYEVV